MYGSGLVFNFPPRLRRALGVVQVRVGLSVFFSAAPPQKKSRMCDLGIPSSTWLYLTSCCLCTRGEGIHATLKFSRLRRGSLFVVEVRTRGIHSACFRPSPPQIFHMVLQRALGGHSDLINKPGRDRPPRPPVRVAILAESGEHGVHDPREGCTP